MKSHKFFLLFLIMLVSPNFLILNASGSVEDQRANLFASNLEFTLETGNKNIVAEIGGKKLDHFISLGSVPKEDGYNLYHARLFFTIEANLYSAYLPDEVFPNALSKKYSTKWLHLVQSVEPAMPWLHPLTETHYSMDYYSWSLGTFSGQGKNGYVTVNAEFKDLTPTTLDFNTVQFETQTKSFVSRVTETKITEVVFSAIGEYDTFYQGENIAELSVLDLSKDANPDGSNGVSNQISNLQLGVTRGTRISSTYQQGAKYVQSGIISDNYFFIKMRPDVKVTEEPLNTRFQKVVVDTKSGILGISPAGIDVSLTGPMIKSTTKRIVGWELQNYNAHITFKTEIDLYSLAKFEYHAESEGDLGDIPAFQLEDMYFNNLFFGDTGAGLVIDSEDPLSSWLSNLWSEYWYIIILVAIIALVIFVGPYLMPFIQGASMGKGKSPARKVKLKTKKVQFEF